MQADRISSILQAGFDDFREWVNPGIASRAELAREPVRAVHARGGRLVLADGREVEDLHGTQAFGHRHPAITAAVRELLDSDSPCWFPSRVNPYAGTLARRLCERAGAEAYSNAFFAASGTEVVEAALKLARAATRRPRILGLDGAYHGCTMGACSLMMRGFLRDPFEPHLPGGETLPFGDVDALRRALEPGDVAAVIVEPIQLEGGVRALPPDYVQALCELTAWHGTLLVADEVQTGLGRTGRYLASETWPRRPDCVLLAKHLGGGLLPASAMLTRRDLWHRAYGQDLETAEAHNVTFGGSAAVAVAALAALDLLDEALLARVREQGERLRRRLREALGHLPLFHEVRGDGLVAGLVLKPTDHPWFSFEHFGMPDLAGKPTVGLLLCHRLYQRGYFCFVSGHDWTVLRIQPRFTIEPERVDDLADVVRDELTRLSDLA